MIKLDKLTKSFGPLVAVDQISLKVSKGEVLGFLGPNGAGKSTTMKMISGFLTPTSGSVEVGGVDVNTEPVTIKNMIGYLPEGAPLYGEMTSKSFLNFIADIRGLRGTNRNNLLEEAIERVNIRNVLDQSIETLSKGYKRRVGLAQAIIHNPPFLILDEPTDGLDPNQKFQVRELIKKMAADKAVIVSTHILEEVEAVCTRAVIIAKGQVLIDETPNELLARSPNQNSLKIEVDKQFANSICADVREIDDVKSTEVLKDFDGKTVIRVFPKDNLNIAINVGAMLKSKGHSIINFSTDKGALDEVFRIVTEDMHKGKDQNA